MPELLEVEQARALIEARGLGRPITRVDAPDAWFLKRGLTPTGVKRALRGRALVTARRRGKLLLVDTDDDGPVLGLHLGMSGRVLDRRRRRRRSAPLREQPRRAASGTGSACASPTVGRCTSGIRAGSARSSSTPTRTGSVPTPSTLTRAQLDRGPHAQPRAGEGRAHGPVAHRRARQPAHRRGAVARRHRPGAPRVDASTPTRSPRSTGRSARRCASLGRPRWFAHRRPHAGPLPRRTVPARRDAVRAPHRRRSHHVLVSAPPALSPHQGCAASALRMRQGA